MAQSISISDPKRLRVRPPTGFRPSPASASFCCPVSTVLARRSSTNPGTFGHRGGQINEINQTSTVTVAYCCRLEEIKTLKVECNCKNIFTTRAKVKGIIFTRMINKTLKNFILQERYFSKSIERSIIKFLDCKDSYVKGGLAEDIIITLVRKSPKNRVGGYEFVSELYRVEKHTVALTGKRDHITHTLNTFILGLYINKNFLNYSVDFNTWKNTALLHDIAYPLEIANKIGDRYFDKLRSTKKNLGVGKYSPMLRSVPKDFEKLTHNKCSFDYIQERIDEWGVKVDVRKRFDDMLSNGQLNHGILGALTILFLIDLFIDKHNPKRKREDIFHGEVNFNQNMFEDRVVSECAAIYLHGLWPNEFYKDLDKRRYPLPYLLKLSDELQNWERVSHDMPDGDPASNYDIEVEKGILKFKVSINKERLRMEQNLECLNDTEVKIVRLQR